MSTAEIEQKIKEEENKYNASLYPGKLPKDIIVNFKKAFLKMPVGNLIVKHLRLPMSKKVNELTRQEVGGMINHILSAPPEAIFGDLPNALDKIEEIQQVVFDYNMDNKRFQDQLVQKRKTYYDLAGNINGRSNILAKA